MPPTGPRRPGIAVRGKFDPVHSRLTIGLQSLLSPDISSGSLQAQVQDRVSRRAHAASAHSNQKTLLSRDPHPEFSTSQVWCRTSGKKLKFLDQSLEIARYYDDDAESDAESRQRQNPPLRHNLDDSVSPSSPHRLQPVTSHASTSSAGSAGPTQQPHRDHPSPVQGSATGSSPRVNPCPPQRSGYSGQVLHHVPRLEHAGGYGLDDPRRYHPFSSQSPSSSNAYSRYRAYDLPPAPLNDHVKAKLFRHYIKNIAPAFDSYDPNRYLADCVPSLAATCPPFLELILLVAARHLDGVEGHIPSSELGSYGQPLPPMDDFLDKLIQSGMDMSHLDVAMLLYHFVQNLQGEISSK
ncbi:hypothetical protein FDECE_15634 [Fusarium decemcellulare]|nr:hypothetical protein FDECE_15634 [Fusarium decemcellulare]